jgi:uncharacterized repeat protein (TIGR01451 family)
MQRLQKWNLGWGRLKSLGLLTLSLSALIIALSVNKASGSFVQLTSDGESEFVPVCETKVSKDGNPTEDTTINSSWVNGAILPNGLETDQTGVFSDTERPMLRPTPILTINKDDDPPDNVQPGAVLTYTITYSNVGNANATAVIVIDTFDNKVKFEGSWPISPAGGAGSVRYWEIDELRKGDHGNITATVIVSTSAVGGTVLTNLVQIDSPDAEMVSSTATTTVVCPRLTINKDDDPPDNVQCGAVLTYTITYGNVGDADATGVIITDTFDTNVIFEGSWPTPTGGTGNVRYWEIGDLPIGGHGNITATVMVSLSAKSSIVLTNLIQIDSPDAEMASKTETTTVVCPVPILTIYLPIIIKSYPKSIFEGFEAGIVPPSGWTLIRTNPNETWEIATNGPHSGSYFANVLCDPARLDQDEVLLSPTFTADTGRVDLWSFGSLYWCRETYDDCDLEIWFVNGSWGGGDDVRLGKTDDDWTRTWRWSHSTLDFSSYASGNPARIALRYVGNNGAQIGVDDIIIIYYPP